MRRHRGLQGKNCSVISDPWSSARGRQGCCCSCLNAAVRGAAGVIASRLVVNSVEELLAALGDDPLAEAGLVEAVLPASGGVVFGAPVTYRAGRAAVLDAREVRGRTGRRAVLTTSWQAGLEFSVPLRDRGDLSPVGIRRAAAALSAPEALAAIQREDPYDLLEEDDLEDAVELEVMRTRRLLGVAPSADEVVAALGPECRRAELDRWLLDWEEGHGDEVAVPDGYLRWFEPGDQCWIVFVPTPESGAALAYMPFYGEAVGALTAERLVAIATSWEHRFGAELVAHWGTMLEFTVARPPRTLDQAWQLAWDHYRVAVTTLSGPGVSVRNHARALVGRDAWFLHERP